MRSWLVVWYGAALLTYAGVSWSDELITAEEAQASQAAVPMLTVDEPSSGNLRHSVEGILTPLSLLIPAFSLLSAPPVLPVWLHSP